MERIYKNYKITTAAGTAKSVVIAPPSSATKWRIVRAAQVPNAATVADGTNYNSVRWYNGTGTGTPITAARNTTSTGWTAFTAEAVTFTGAGSQLESTQAAPVHIDVTHSGSGAVFDHEIEVEIEVLS